MIKDTKSDLFSNVFVPDISKISELIYNKKIEFFEIKEDCSTKDEEGYLGLKGYLGKLLTPILYLSRTR